MTAPLGIDGAIDGAIDGPIDGPMVGATVGAMDGAIFLTYVKDFLCPTLQPGDQVIADNLSSHKVAGVREAIGAVGASIRYLPP